MLKEPLIAGARVVVHPVTDLRQQIDLSRSGEQAADARRSLRLTCKNHHALEWEEAGVISLDYEVVGIGPGLGGRIAVLRLEDASKAGLASSGTRRV